jgi:hypothetical protein
MVVNNKKIQKLEEEEKELETMSILKRDIKKLISLRKN